MSKSNLKMGIYIGAKFVIKGVLREKSILPIDIINIYINI